jgi:hypothetical protein
MSRQPFYLTGNDLVSRGRSLAKKPEGKGDL